MMEIIIRKFNSNNSEVERETFFRKILRELFLKNLVTVADIKFFESVKLNYKFVSEESYS